METKKSNVVTLFVWYMYNKWSLEESIRVFGENLGLHIYEKKDHMHEMGYDILYWYGTLDETCRQKLVNRAIEIYSNK